MLTNHFFRDIYNDHWGDPENPHAVEPCRTVDRDHIAASGILGHLRRLFRRRRDRPSAWSFTIPSKASEDDDQATADLRHQCDATQPKFLAIAKALSRNC